MNLTEIGIQFREARRRRGLSQEKVAGPLGMSRATLSALESGRHIEIGVRKLAALLNSVGLDLFAGPRRVRPTLDDLRAERLRGKKIP